MTNTTTNQGVIKTINKENAYGREGKILEDYIIEAFDLY